MAALGDTGFAEKQEEPQRGASVAHSRPSESERCAESPNPQPVAPQSPLFHPQALAQTFLPWKNPIYLFSEERLLFLSQWMEKYPFKKFNEWRASTLFFTPFLYWFPCSQRFEMPPGLGVGWGGVCSKRSLKSGRRLLSDKERILHWAPRLHRACTPPGAPWSLYLWDLRCLPPITFPPSSWSCLISLIAGLWQQAAWGGVLTLYFPCTLQVLRAPGGPFCQVFLQWPKPTTVCSESRLFQNNTNAKIIVTSTHGQHFKIISGISWMLCTVHYMFYIDIFTHKCLFHLFRTSGIIQYICLGDLPWWLKDTSSL